MNPSDTDPQDLQTLRQLREAAEAALASQRAGPAPAQADLQRMLHDLQVHQIELEMQNEALRQAQQALEVSRDRYADLYDFAPVGYFTLSADGMVEEINLTAVTLLGAERKHVLQRSFTQWVAPLDQQCWMQLFIRLKEHGGKGTVELALQRSDGSSFAAQLDGMGLGDGAAAHKVRVAMADISERKQTQAQLVAAKAEAEEANQAKSRFLAAASHDLRQPMAALALYSGMLATAVKPGQEKLAYHMQNCVDSLSVLLNDLLDVSKLDAGVVVPKIAEFSFEALCNPLLPIYRAKAEHKGLQLRCRPAALVMLRSDQRLLHRLLGNLLDNAVQYTTQGGVLLATRRHAGKRWIEVWDTGLGIPQDQIPHVFEEFRQLGDAARTRGSGLGLAIVAKTAALLGLQVRVRSRLGRGSMFAIELPEGSAPQEQEQVLASPPAQSSLAAAAIDTASNAATDAEAATRPLTVAVVEDNPLVLQALVLALQGFGNTVVGATTGAQLLELLWHRELDIVVSDYRLAGGQTGFDVIKSVRARYGASLPAIVLTGDTNPVLIRNMAAKGIPVYFKPLRMEVLQNHILEAVKLRAP